MTHIDTPPVTKSGNYYSLRNVSRVSLVSSWKRKILKEIK